MSAHDSLAPHVEGIARSKRVRAWVFAAVFSMGGALATCTLKVWLWADGFVKHVELIDIWTGIPETDTASQRAKLWRTPSLPARLDVLECERAMREAAELKHDHDLFQRYVSLTAATSERSPQRRAEAAGKAVQLFESSANCQGEVPPKDACSQVSAKDKDKQKPDRLYQCSEAPAEAARTALETPIPR